MKAKKSPIKSFLSLSPAQRVYDGKKKTIKIKIEVSLLKQFDKFARRNDMTRDEFIARSLRSAIAFAG